MKTIILAAAIALISGCSTIDSLQPNSGGSTFVVKGKSYDDVWKAAVRTSSRSLTIVESDKATGTLKAEKGVGMGTWGEVVGVFIKPPTNGAESYSVEVQSMKRSKVQISGQDWKNTIISGMQAELDQ